jgi:hypothetical protein
MARPLSYQSEPWQIFEITTRCIHGRYLLTPGDESNRRVLGVLGRAQELFGEHVQVHMVAGTSNHLHILVTSRDAAWRARFKSHVKTNLSKELGDLHGWNEHVFGRRARDIPILDEAALLERVRYFLAHGVKEGLVEHPEDWPGPAWVRALTAGERLVGRWYRRSEFYHHVRNWMRRKHPTSAARPVLDEFGEDKELKLVPLPIWSHLTEGERATRFRAIIDGLVARPARNEDLEEVQVGVGTRHGPPPTGPRRDSPPASPRTPGPTEEDTCTVGPHDERRAPDGLDGGVQGVRIRLANRDVASPRRGSGQRPAPWRCPVPAGNGSAWAATVVCPGKRELTEENIDEALRDIRVSLLEADVDFKVVRSSSPRSRRRPSARSCRVEVKGQGEKRQGHRATTSSTSATTSSRPSWGPSTRRSASGGHEITTIMMVGLQGAGKTTTTGKLARKLLDEGPQAAAGRRRHLPPGRHRSAQGPRAALDVPVYSSPAGARRSSARRRSTRRASARAATSSSSTPPVASPSTSS